MQAARATEAFNSVQFQRVEYSACARVKLEESAALLKIFGSEGITDQSDRIKVVAQPKHCERIIACAAGGRGDPCTQ